MRALAGFDIRGPMVNHSRLGLFSDSSCVSRFSRTPSSLERVMTK